MKGVIISAKLGILENWLSNAVCIPVILHNKYIKNLAIRWLLVLPAYILTMFTFAIFSAPLLLVMIFGMLVESVNNIE